ncbi:hypothetical protein ABTX81_30230 [Kitasatospora sp. NPDC097605]|uniref:hypothetical protein n=1 Tax=Kitasatospora sp. NPDC097605 TaxID=3157226 RepID=UPI00332D4D8E
MASSTAGELRIISSPYERVTVDEETAERIEPLAHAGQELRRSEGLDEYGQVTYLLQLIAFYDGGQPRFAVRHQRPDSDELWDSEDRGVADAAYEEQGRDAAENAPWERTDIEGLAAAGYEYTVEVQDGPDEAFRTLVTGTGTLSAHPEWDNDLEEAAREIGSERVRDIERGNEEAALNEALGERWYDRAEHIGRLRVTVTQDGEEMAVHEWTFEPADPDPATVARLREFIRRERAAANDPYADFDLL